MRDLIVQWLTQITAPFGKALYRLTSLLLLCKKHFIWCFCNAIWLYLGLYSGHHFIGHTS